MARVFRAMLILCNPQSWTISILTLDCGKEKRPHYLDGSRFAASNNIQLMNSPKPATVDSMDHRAGRGAHLQDDNLQPTKASNLSQGTGSDGQHEPPNIHSFENTHVKHLVCFLSFIQVILSPAAWIHRCVDGQTEVENNSCGVIICVPHILVKLSFNTIGT